METNDVHFQRGCHHHPSLPCHTSVYNCCTHIGRCGYSAVPKRPRFEGDKLLPMIETGTTKPVVNATLQTLQAYHQSLPCRPHSPPPLLKKFQNGFVHKTSELTNFETETRKTSHARSTSVTAPKNVSSTHSNGCLKDNIKCFDESLELHSTAFRESTTALSKVPPQISPATRFEISKCVYSRVFGKKSNVNGEQQHKKLNNEIEKCNRSSQNGKSVSLSQVKKDCTEKRSGCQQSADGKMESYSIRSAEQPEHYISSKARDAALHCRTTRDDVQQMCHQKQLLAKPQEDSFVLRDDNKNAKRQSSDSNLKQYTSECKCCNEPKSSPGIPTRRRQSMPHLYHALSSAPTDYKEECPIRTRENLYHNNNATNQENKSFPATSPTGYPKCSTGLSKHTYQDEQFTPMWGDKIDQCHPTPKVNLQRYDDTPVKSQVSYLKPKSDVPQLRRGRPRTRDVKDTTPVYDHGVPTCSPKSRQPHLSKSMSCDKPQCNRITQNNDDDNDDDVFIVSSCSDINNNSTATTNKIPYQRFVPNDNSTTSERNFENEHQIRRHSVALDQPRKSTTLGRPHDRDTNNSITSPCQEYQFFSSDKTHKVANIDQNHAKMGSLTQYEDASRDHCQKSPSVSTPTINANTTLCQGQKRKSPLAPCNDSAKFVTSLNDLLKRRTDSSEENHRSNNFSFFETHRQDVTQFQNKPVGVQGSHCQEGRREASKCHDKWSTKPLEGGHRKSINLESDEHRRMDITPFPKESTESQRSHRHETKEEPRRSATLRLPIPSCEKVESHDYKAITFISSGNQDSNKVETKALHDQTQPTYPPSRPVPPPPAEDVLDNMDNGCGGYAIDHNSLPKIVAVHSIVNRDETRREEESNLFSASDKKYWNELLKKLSSEMSNFKRESEVQHSVPERTPQVNHTSTLSRRLLEGSKNSDAQKQTMPSPKDSDVTYPSRKDSSMQPKSINETKINDNISELKMWEYLSTPSRNITIEVRSPLAFAETEKKSQLPRKKPSVAELCEKILTTRERIKKETIAWKKKLLYSLEAIFIKRLRKTEKETGEKADISFEEETPKEESKEKKNGQKERRNSLGGKEKVAGPQKERRNSVGAKEKVVGPRHKQTTKKL